MGLIENITQDEFSSNVFVLIRHGVDVPVLSHDLDQPLIEETKPDVSVLGKQISNLCKKIATKNVAVRHSNRLRATQTASIIADELQTDGTTVDMIEASGVREIYQGDFIIKDYIVGTMYKPLVDAWQAWQQKLDAHELLYRFGDPLQTATGCTYPELSGWFTNFGEHQAEFSLRLYSFLKETLEDSSNRLQIIVGHQASCSRIQRIIDSITKLKTADDFLPGEFVTVIEKKGLRTTLGAACGIIIKKPHMILANAVLEKEIAFLKTII